MKYILGSLMLFTTAADALVSVKVMVESFCPCSGAWEGNFQDSVSPAVGSIVNLTRIFDAAAKGTQGCCNPSADDDATCMHGKEECVADALQRCVQGHYQQWHQWLNYTYCIQGDCSKRPDAAGCKTQFIVGKDENKELEQRCAEEQNLDYDEIKTCWQGDEGVYFMQSDADACDELPFTYGIKGLPVVWVNGELFSRFFDCDASTEKYNEALIAAICDANDSDDVPDACKN